jgi:hypothetical protein
MISYCVWSSFCEDVCTKWWCTIATGTSKNRPCKGCFTYWSHISLRVYSTLYLVHLRHKLLHSRIIPTFLPLSYYKVTVFTTFSIFSHFHQDRPTNQVYVDCNIDCGGGTAKQAPHRVHMSPSCSLSVQSMARPEPPSYHVYHIDLTWTHVNILFQYLK